MNVKQCIGVGALTASLIAASANASELSYTFLDFEVIDHDLDLVGTQTPTPGQTVTVTTGGGEGISVAGGVALPAGFYVGGRFRSAIVDVTGTIRSPLTVVTAIDEFDLVTSELVVGYTRELAMNFDMIAELSRDTADYDFGSFARENFDVDDSGIGGRFGFRWNPQRAFELFASARYTPVGEPLLTERDFDADTRLNLGLRWYFFEDLGLGVEYESGDVSTLTIAMRFSFGNLRW
jgi:hypothetical protein